MNRWLSFDRMLTNRFALFPKNNTIERMKNHLENLAVLSRKPERLVLGLLSGTSMDAIDVAVCRIGPKGRPVQLVHVGRRPFESTLRVRLSRLDELRIQDVAEIHVLLGEAFATAALEVVAESPVHIEDVDLIGSHGQTVYHHSTLPGALRATLQLGDADVIAERTGKPVIADFRARDIASGGEGAPLTPTTDVYLYGHDSGTGRRAVLNLGGIANVTVLDADPERVLGFDTGPANALIDRAARRMSNGALSCDRDGMIARSGRVNERLLEELIESDPFLNRTPPKSTGFEMYGDAFLDHVAKRHGGVDADLLATLTEFSARAVALAFARHIQVVPEVDEIVVAGGGASNPALMDRLSALLSPRRVRRSEEFGVPSTAREAMAFAILADLALRGEPGSTPAITGARRPPVLGKLSFPNVAKPTTGC